MRDFAGPDDSNDVTGFVGYFGRSLREYAVYTLTPDGTVASWNPGAERITGASPAEVIGQDVSMFYPAEQRRAGLPHWLLEQAAEFGSYVDEGWRVRKDGSTFWAHVVTTALRAPDGTLLGFARLTRDDTEPHTRLERSMRLFFDLFDLAPVGIALFDRHGYVLDANRALYELLHYRSEGLPGAHASQLVHPDEPGLPRMIEAFRTGNPPDTDRYPEWSLIRSDGERVFCELRINRSMRESGDPFWLVAVQDITDRRRQAVELRYWATHDDLTGLPNRAAIPDLLRGTDRGRLAVLYCDLNNFKRINESLGHSAGDEVLIALAKRLESQLPAGWPVVRAAGDEYLIICPDVVSAGGVEAVAAQVSQLFRTTVALRGQLVQTSASIGVAVASDDSSVDDLVRVASAAALHKNPGSDHITLAEPPLLESIDRQVLLETQLREAIEKDQLELLYQPIVDRAGRIVSAEALIRWHHPERGLLTPDVLLPVAEQGDLMRDLDRWVLRRAVLDAVQWPTPNGGDPVAVSVNIAETVHSDRGFLTNLTELVDSSGIGWDRIIVEIVETSMIDLPSRTRTVMRTLVDLGVRFAVDDFGTGYSSLARVKDFSAQIIKIDREFVSAIDRARPTNLAVVKAMVDLATAIGSTCTAEGVETVEQFRALREINVTTFQGWLFSRAVPSAELCSLIEAGPIDIR